MAKSSSRSRTIDFGGVDPEIRKHSEKAARVPEGDYVVKVVKGDYKENEDTGAAGYNWRCQIVKPAKYKGKSLFGYTSLNPDALWNLRNLINAALGKNVAGKKANFNPETIEGKIVGASVEDDEYKGKVKSRISVFFPKDEAHLADDKDEDDDEDEDDDDETEEEDDEDEDEDLEEVEVEDI